MSKMIQCDKCGTIIPSKAGEYTWHITSVIDSGCMATPDHYDLCEKCVGEFYNFMKGKKNGS